MQTIPYTGGANQYAKVTMTFASSSDVGSAMLFVMTSAGALTSNYTTFKNYQHMNPISNNEFDLEHANIGVDQVVQINLGPSSTTLIIHVYNF